MENIYTTAKIKGKKMEGWNGMKRRPCKFLFKVVRKMSALIIKRVASRILLVRLHLARCTHACHVARDRGRGGDVSEKRVVSGKRGRVTHPSLFAAGKRSGGLTSSER